MRRRSRAGHEPIKTRNRKTATLKGRKDQQTATSDVLKVISRSAFDLSAVLSTLVHSAAKLCDAECAFIFRLEDGVYRLSANHGFSEEYRQFIVSNPIKPGRGTLVGRTALEASTVHLPDCLADPEYVWTESQRIGDFRTMLGVPLLREGNPIGVIALTRSVVRPFTDKQIELIETSADQAGIAIENVRLFEAEQQRTAELTESLEQQTATSEVLKVISSSPGELEPVFLAMLENATRICEAKFGTLYRYDGKAFHPAAGSGTPAELLDIQKRRGYSFLSQELFSTASCRRGRWRVAQTIRPRQVSACRPNMVARAQPSWCRCSRITGWLAPLPSTGKKFGRSRPSKSSC
jgi:two-component system, NtrC family, sensor kinase